MGVVTFMLCLTTYILWTYINYSQPSNVKAHAVIQTKLKTSYILNATLYISQG